MILLPPLIQESKATQQLNPQNIKKTEMESGSIYFEATVGYFKFNSLDQKNIQVSLPDQSSLNVTDPSDRFAPITTSANGLGDLLFAEEEKVISWLEANPARVAVAGLIDLGRSGNVAQIRERIKPLLNMTWERWWRKTRPHLENLEFVRTGRNRSFRLDQGFDVSHVVAPDADSTNTRTSRLNTKELEQEAIKLLTEPETIIEIPLSDFRRVIQILGESNRLNAIFEDLQTRDFNSAQLWALFDYSNEPAEQAKAAARAIELAVGHDQKPPRHLPNQNDLKIFKNFLPKISSVLLDIQHQVHSTEIERIESATLSSLLGDRAEDHESATAIIEDLLVTCIRLRPETFLESLLEMHESEKDRLFEQRIIEGIFSTKHISSIQARGIWLSYIADRRFDIKIASRISDASFDKESSRTQSIAAAQEFNLRVTAQADSDREASLDSKMMAALAGGIDDKNAQEIEKDIIGQARASMNSSTARRANSLVEIIVKAITSRTRSMGETNRLLRSDNKNLTTSLLTLKEENSDLRNRLSHLSKESVQSIAQAKVDSQRELLRQVANALQFAQYSVHRSGDASRIENFSRTLAELEQYLPMRSNGIMNKSIPFDPGNLDWKGNRSNRPLPEDPVTIVAQGWQWNPHPSSYEILARPWCMITM